MNRLHKTHSRRFWGRSRRSGGRQSVIRPLFPEPLEDRRMLATLAVEPAAEIANEAVEIRPAAVVQQALKTPDFNRDKVLDGSDIDALIGEIAAGCHARRYDLTGDGVVDLDDRDAWLLEAGEKNIGAGYLLGDATLDGVVDGSDRNVWNAHRFTEVTGYCSGDFNADGVVDVSDWNILNENMFTTSAELGRHRALRAKLASVAQVVEHPNRVLQVSAERSTPASRVAFQAVPEREIVDAVFADYE